MKNKREKCEQLYKKWKILEDKLPKTQIGVSHKRYEVSYISQDERNEFDRITNELKEECLDFLDFKNRFEIEERYGIIRYRKTRR